MSYRVIDIILYIGVALAALLGGIVASFIANDPQPRSPKECGCIVFIFIDMIHIFSRQLVVYLGLTPHNLCDFKYNISMLL